MKYDTQLLDQQAVEILLKNIHSHVTFLLKVFTIQTFEKLIKKALVYKRKPSRRRLVNSSRANPNHKKSMRKRAQCQQWIRGNNQLNRHQNRLSSNKLHCPLTKCRGHNTKPHPDSSLLTTCLSCSPGCQHRDHHTDCLHHSSRHIASNRRLIRTKDLLKIGQSLSFQEGGY